jgi:hypothetical protein
MAYPIVLSEILDGPPGVKNPGVHADRGWSVWPVDHAIFKID